jgi:hypothetical protein
VPGWNEGLSWKLVTDGDQPGIVFKVWHFSSLWLRAVEALPTPEHRRESRLEKLGCFITTIMK